MSAAATTCTTSSAPGGLDPLLEGNITSNRHPSRRSPRSADLPDREDLREGPVARDPERAAGLHAAGAAAARGAASTPARRRSPRAIYEVMVSATVTAKVGDKTLFLAEAVQAGIFQMRNVPADDLEAAARHRLPDDPLPVPARGDLRPGDPRRLPAGAARAGLVRGALPAAPAAGAGAQGADPDGPRIEVAR